MVIFLAWLNVTLAVIAMTLFMVRRLNKVIVKKGGKRWIKPIRLLSKIHPYVGLCLLITGLVHGYLAVSAVFLHTGYLTWIAIVGLFVLRMWGLIYKNRFWIRWHRAAALIFVVALLVHIFARNII